VDLPVTPQKVRRSSIIGTRTDGINSE
jgi:hypothetical protein